MDSQQALLFPCTYQQHVWQPRSWWWCVHRALRADTGPPDCTQWSVCQTRSSAALCRHTAAPPDGPSAYPRSGLADTVCLESPDL